MHRICCKHALQGKAANCSWHISIPKEVISIAKLNCEDCEFGAKIEIRIVLTHFQEYLAKNCAAVWTPGFEDILDIGVNNGWYNPSNLLQALIFDGSSSRGFKRSLTCIGIGSITLQNVQIVIRYFPHGVPNHMYEAPEDYGALDFKIRVNPIAIAEVRNLYAPPDHDVFELVPRDFTIIDDIELIPNLLPLHKGADVIGTDGTYYMGDSVQSSQLDAMIDRDEPLPVGAGGFRRGGSTDHLVSEDEGGQDSDHDEW
ncbi:hypothetical protein B0H14DRAFT_3159167 [Mycena olivaceomarginata]|nr:hypothetical protein B0H14DRAFT_3159167 [Mycena olivaceomarginata]